MPQRRETYVNLDARSRRKLQDERRMHFRRAIESYDEQRQLHAQLVEFPDLLMVSPLLELGSVDVSFAAAPEPVFARD